MWGKDSQSQIYTRKHAASNKIPRLILMIQYNFLLNKLETLVSKMLLVFSLFTRIKTFVVANILDFNN